MCGICGISNFKTKKSVYNLELKVMTDSLVHRGPDDEGFFLENEIGLGHRRLSIIDLGKGHQPMYNEDNTLCIIFNGEFYNYKEYITMLSDKGHDFKTNSDTEVILHLYEEYGIECLRYINGMFALVIYDKKQRKLFIARDRIGVKPLYYYINDDGISFASEIKPLLRLNNIKPEIDTQAFFDYIHFQYSLDDHSLFKGIRKLMPGYFMIVDDDIKINQYWDYNYDYNNIDLVHHENYFVDKLTELLYDAVKIRLNSDVEIGTFLSGGLDSSTISVLASKLSDNPIRTFSGGYKVDNLVDETYYSSIVAKQIKSIHNIIYQNADDNLNVLKDNVFEIFEEPVAGPCSPNFILNKAIRNQVKVALNGSGGDEIFGGYVRYYIALLEKAIFSKIKGNEFEFSLKDLEKNIYQMQGYEGLLLNYRNTYTDSKKELYYNLILRGDLIVSILSKEYKDKLIDYNPYERFIEIFERKNTSYLNKILYFEDKCSLPALVQLDDRGGMSVNLEIRSPLMDYRIAELMATVPDNIKLKNGELKYLYKKAVSKILPKEITERKEKSGTLYPIYIHFKREYKEFIQSKIYSESLLNSNIFDREKLLKLKQTNKPIPNRAMWGLLSIALWNEVYFN